MKRLKALETSDDGFKLAEADLDSRGAGRSVWQKTMGRERSRYGGAEKYKTDSGGA